MVLLKRGRIRFALTSGHDEDDRLLQSTYLRVMCVGEMHEKKMQNNT